MGRWGKALMVASMVSALTVAEVGAAVADSGTTPSYQHYVALGDSYSAGPLIPVQQASWCFRSSNNYPSWLATKLGIYDTSGAFTDVTCGSADTTNMTQSQATPTPGIHLSTQPPQFDALTLDTDLVTVGIGGNDYSAFGSMIYTCPGLRDSDPTGSPCRKHFTVNGTDTIMAALVHTEQNVERVVQGVHERSPGAKVVLVGYPRLVPPSGYCPDVVPFADGDYAYFDKVERTLNAAVSTAARRQNATYVDTYGPSLGHDACAGSAAWVRGQSTNLFAGAAYHPNKAAMQAEASLVFKALGGTSPETDASPAPRNPASQKTLTRMVNTAGAQNLR